MSFNLAELQVHIREILTSPGTDLSTISAKGVRQKLTEVVFWLKPEVATQRKQEIDKAITEIYQAICPDSAEAEEAASAEETRKRKQERDEENASQGPDEDDAQPAKKVKSQNARPFLPNFLSFTQPTAREPFIMDSELRDRLLLQDRLIQDLHDRLLNMVSRSELDEFKKELSVSQLARNMESRSELDEFKKELAVSSRSELDELKKKLAALPDAFKKELAVSPALNSTS